MSNNLLIISIILIALGTYMSRAIPLFINIEALLGEKRKRLVRHFFYLMGSAIIVALFVTSIDLSIFSIEKLQVLISMISGFIAIIMAHFIFNNSGISVLIGLISYLSASLLFVKFLS